MKNSARLLTFVLLLFLFSFANSCDEEKEVNDEVIDNNNNDSTDKFTFDRDDLIGCWDTEGFENKNGEYIKSIEFTENDSMSVFWLDNEFHTIILWKFDSSENILSFDERKFQITGFKDDILELDEFTEDNNSNTFTFTRTYECPEKIIKEELSDELIIGCWKVISINVNGSSMPDDIRPKFLKFFNDGFFFEKFDTKYWVRSNKWTLDSEHKILRISQMEYNVIKFSNSQLVLKAEGLNEQGNYAYSIITLEKESDCPVFIEQKSFMSADVEGADIDSFYTNEVEYRLLSVMNVTGRFYSDEIRYSINVVKGSDYSNVYVYSNDKDFDSFDIEMEMETTESTIEGTFSFVAINRENSEEIFKFTNGKFKIYLEEMGNVK
jgi:hypothetical protein